MRIPIRIQLGGVILVSSLIGLAVISIAVWVTIHEFVLDLRASRLALTASLKAAQLATNLDSQCSLICYALPRLVCGDPSFCANTMYQLCRPAQVSFRQEFSSKTLSSGTTPKVTTQMPTGSTASPTSKLRSAERLLLDRPCCSKPESGPKTPQAPVTREAC